MHEKMILFLPYIVLFIRNLKFIDMEFIKYPTIDTDTNPKASRNTSSEQWVVTEKVHGANIGIYLDLCNIGTDGWLLVAKRTGFLTEADKKQFPVDPWLETNRANLEQTARNVIGHLAEPIQPGTYLVIFGEFYGGWFPANSGEWKGSKSLPAEMKACEVRPRPVQWDVYYAPTFEIVCFDMVAITPGHKPTKPDGSPVLASEVIRYQNWLPNEFVRAQPIPHVPIVFTGSLDECIKYANSDAKYVNSRVPELIHGLPPLTPGTNIIEGVVVSPATGAHFSYKIKNKAFQETVKTVHVPNKDGTGKPTGHPFLAYVTRNRWNAVRSKYGAIGITELKAAFVADALEDFQSENPDSKSVDVTSLYIANALEQFYSGLGELDASISQ
jgi:hypothetical protein